MNSLAFGERFGAVIDVECGIMISNRSSPFLSCSRWSRRPRLAELNATVLAGSAAIGSLGASGCAIASVGLEISWARTVEDVRDRFFSSISRNLASHRALRSASNRASSSSLSRLRSSAFLAITSFMWAISSISCLEGRAGAAVFEDSTRACICLSLGRISTPLPPLRRSARG